MKSIGIIPARYHSTRFPGKPLVVIEGKSMIQRVYEQATKCKDLSRVLVATDHNLILEHVINFGGEAMLTDPTHASGTDRCAEAMQAVLSDGLEHFDVVVNIQGDEPFIFPQQISELVRCFLEPSVSIATLARKMANQEEIVDPNVVKLVFDDHHRVLYFSRAAIPFVRETSGERIPAGGYYFQHVGIYGYRPAVLAQLVKLRESSLEQTEKLEQLRWLQNGFQVFVHETEYENVSIDTPSDLIKISNRKG